MFNNPAYQYAQFCATDTSGKVPQYVRKQAEKWLVIADGDDSEAYLDEKSLAQVCNLLKVLQHPDLHKPMYESLEDYQWLFIVAVLCTMDREEHVRYYTTGLLEIARKNFKTFTSAIIFILLMLMEPPMSRFFSVAPDKSLSSELKVAIKKIIKSTPALIDDVNPMFKVMRSEIRCLLNDNTYDPLAYSQDRLDGKQANAFLADEVGAMDTYPVEAMRTSQLVLRNKLGVIISTQYPNDSNGFTDEVDISKKAIDGLLDGERRFSLLYEPDLELQQGDLWQTDDRCIWQANPVAVSNEHVFNELRKARQLAKLYENKRENFLCKNLNILYKGMGVEGYVDIQAVKKCRRETNKDWWIGRRVWLGLDLSMTNDNTAVSMVTDDNGTIVANTRFFIPAGRIDIKSSKERVDYRREVREGTCVACGDEIIDYPTVERYIMDLPKTFGVDVVQVGYDRWNAISTVQKLEEQSIECVEVKQHSSVLHAPTKLLKEKILSGDFVYDANRLLEINFENARCTQDTNLNGYVNKKKSEGKVDGVVSLIDAVYLLQQDNLYNDGFVALVV